LQNANIADSLHFFISLQKCKIINPRLLIKSAVVKFIGFVYHL
jgi:hypothetical protein